MEYVIECTKADVLLYNHRYTMLCEAKSTPEVETKKVGIIQKIIGKIKNLITRIKFWIQEKQINAMNRRLGNSKSTVEVEIPENETPKSFIAKIDLFIKKLKSKKITKEQVEDMRKKLAKGVVVAIPATTAALLMKNMLQAIPVSDALANEYDRKMKNAEKRKARVGHKGVDEDTTFLTFIPSIIGSFQNAIGKMSNAIHKKKETSAMSYSDMNFTERRQANKQIKKDAKHKAAAAKDKMIKCKNTMDKLVNNNASEEEISTARSSYNNAKKEYKKYKNIYSNKHD